MMSNSPVVASIAIAHSSEVEARNVRHRWDVRRHRDGRRRRMLDLRQRGQVIEMALDNFIQGCTAPSDGGSTSIPAADYVDRVAMGLDLILRRSPLCR